MRLGVGSAGRPALALLVIVLLVAPPAAVALNLPDPPDPNDPANNVNGPLGGQYTAFTGGILLQKDSEADVTVPQNEFIAEFVCVEATRVVAKVVKSDMGLSVHGPLSGGQTQGIIDAMNSVRPPKTVTLTTTVTGTATTKDVWTLTGITYTETTYKVYAIVTAVPASERLVGYIVVSVPKALVTEDAQTPCPTPAPPPLITIGDKFTAAPPPRSFFDVFYEITRLPDDGIGPFFQYGRVYVYSGGQTVGAANVRPGETVQMRLPSGSYNVQADVGVFGLHFNVDGGSFSSQNPVILSVTLSVEAYVYTIIIVLVGLACIVGYLILRRVLGRGGKPGATQTTPQAGDDKTQPQTWNHECIDGHTWTTQNAPPAGRDCPTCGGRCISHAH